VVAILLENDSKGSKVRLPALHIAAKKNDTKAATLLLQGESQPDLNYKVCLLSLILKFYFLQINLKINREEVLLIVQQRFVFSMSRWCFVLFTIVYLMVLESFYCSMLSSYFIILIFSFSFYSLAE